MRERALVVLVEVDQPNLAGRLLREPNDALVSPAQVEVDADRLGGVVWQRADAVHAPAPRAAREHRWRRQAHNGIRPARRAGKRQDHARAGVPSPQTARTETKGWRSSNDRTSNGS